VIPENNQNQVTSTVVGNAVGMTIEEAAMGHIMNVLTNLYSDEELAVVREYSTNALDSHIEAGQSRPIEVSLPTDLRPILSIRDFGLGLSAREIETIYSRYGASTKRETDDAIGMLGLGCKSALAYVDQFTLVAIKDGERITVSVARDENGAGVMTILDREASAEEPGVEVLIPAKRGNAFKQKAEEFFRWWEPGTVLVNGEKPTPVEPIWQIDEEFSIIDKGGYDRKLRIIMGNVSYPISFDYEHESNILAALPDDKQIIARVPIGMVSFTPSRESLQEHPGTKAALDQILATFKTAAEHAIKSQIAGAPDKPTAAKTLLAARDALGASNVPVVIYRGEIIPTVISAEHLPGAGLTDRRGNYRYGLWKAGSRGGRRAAGQITLDQAAEMPWIINYKNYTWSKTQRHKLNRYLAEHGIGTEDQRKSNVLITDAAAVPLPEWIDGNVLIVDWEKVRKWKDPKNATEGGTGPGKYAGTYPTYFHSPEHALTRWNDKYPADKLPKSGRNLYYCNSQGRELQRALGHRAVVVEMPPHRQAKFLRLFPHARHARNTMIKAAEQWWLKLDDYDALAVVLGTRISAFDKFKGISAESVDDPQLREALVARDRWNNDKHLKAAYNKFSSYLYLDDACDGIHSECDYIAAKYPLIENIDTYYYRPHKLLYKHLTIYINAVYAAEKR
jgi:hypothetical protein